jgi:hypothetical protein
MSENGRSRSSAQHSIASATTTIPSTQHHTALVPRRDSAALDGAAARVPGLACTGPPFQGEHEVTVNEAPASLVVTIGSYGLGRAPQPAPSGISS